MRRSPATLPSLTCALAAALAGGCAAPPAADQGDFVASYVEPEEPYLLDVYVGFQDMEILEGVLQGFNEMLALPRDVPVVFTECGQANAFYAQDSGEVILCYELLDELADTFYEGLETEEDLAVADVSVAGANLFVLFHEIGHALVDVYDLPITGREEDAVDQLATVLLVESGDEDWEKAALDAALFFGVRSEQIELTEESFWQQHSLEAQRFYNIVCWLFGSDPERWAGLVEAEYLPPARAERCPAEYERMAVSWMALLDPYVKRG